MHHTQKLEGDLVLVTLHAKLRMVSSPSQLLWDNDSSGILLWRPILLGKVGIE